MRQIVALRPSLVVAGSATTHLDSDRAGRPAVNLQQWRDAMRRTLLVFSRGGIPVAEMRDTPKPGFEVPTCLARSARHGWYPAGTAIFHAHRRCTPQLSPPSRRRPMDFVSVHLIDMTDQLCDSRVCWALKDGVVVYRDDNHLTGKYAATLAPFSNRNSLP